MKNAKLTLNGTKLTIEIDLAQRLGVSKSGKSETIASTFGNIPVPGAAQGEVLSLNVYVPKK